MLSTLIDSSKKNIWRYAKLYSPFIRESEQLTLNEGATVCIELPGLSRELGRRFIFKREDKNPTGSHKARALAYQVSYYKSCGHKTLLVSSSGNAAISAAHYCRLAGIALLAFVDNKTNKAKINEIKKTGQHIIFCAKPINFANYASKIFSIPNLRPSTDDLSIEPYKSIAFEIYEEFGDSIDALCVFPTSASSLIGVARGFLQMQGELGDMKRIPKIVAVQTGDIVSIAKSFYNSTPSGFAESAGVAGALGVKTTGRTIEAVDIIKKTGGTGIIVSDNEILSADEILKRYGISTSMEGAATFAGAQKLKDARTIVCLLTGREYQDTDDDGHGNVYHAENYTEIKEIVSGIINDKQ